MKCQLNLNINCFVRFFLILKIIFIAKISKYDWFELILILEMGEWRIDILEMEEWEINILGKISLTMKHIW